jgi:hypothetical protein
VSTRGTFSGFKRQVSCMKSICVKFSL